MRTPSRSVSTARPAPYSRREASSRARPRGVPRLALRGSSCRSSFERTRVSVGAALAAGVGEAARARVRRGGEVRGGRICGISVSSSRGGRSSGRRTVSTRKLSGRGTSKENAYVRNRRGWWPRSRLRAWRRSAGACGARTAAAPDGEIKLASEIIHGATNGMWRHMPAFSHAVGQILQRRRRRPEALVHESELARNDPHPEAPHLPISYDSGPPRSVIRFRMLHASSASALCPPGVRARRPVPMIDLYLKKAFSTRACRW